MIKFLSAKVKQTPGQVKKESRCEPDFFRNGPILIGQALFIDNLA